MVCCTGMIKYKRISKFALVGVAGTMCHYISFILLNELTNIRPYVASMMSATMGAIINYLLNYHWTFSDNNVTYGESAIKTGLLVCALIFLNGLIVYLLENILYYLIAQILATIFVFFFNYFVSSLWVFKCYGKKF